MKRQKTFIGFYTRMRKTRKRYHIRVGINMSSLKDEEYKKLRQYLYTGFINPYGSYIALCRFYKNIKYRKKYVYSLVRNTKERNRYMNLVNKLKAE